MAARLDKDTESFIDALRGLAALAVLVTHSFDFGIRGVYGDSLAEAPEAWRWAAATVGHGSFMVWCFFVVSGLCIHLSIDRSLAAHNFSPLHYAAARITRIYPLFLLGLLLAIIVWWFTDHLSCEPAARPWPQFVSSLLSLQIFTSTFPNFMPSWSLSSEMLYYAAWPLLLGATRWDASSAFTLALISSFVVCVLIGAFWNALQWFEASTAVNGLWSVSVLFPLWLSGAWLAQHWDEVSRKIRRRLWLVSLPLCLIAELTLAWIKFNNGSQAVIDSIGLISIPGLVLLLAGARHARLGSWPQAQPFVRWLGQFSYPCYVLHMPVMILIQRLVIPDLPLALISHPVTRSLLLLLPALLVLILVGPWLERCVMAWRSILLSRIK